MQRPAPIVGHLRFCPLLSSVAQTRGDRGYVATRPTCGPPVILFPAVKCRVPSRRQGLCSHPAHLWATCEFVARSEALGNPKAVGVM